MRGPRRATTIYSIRARSYSNGRWSVVAERIERADGRERKEQAVVKCGLTRAEAEELMARCRRAPAGAWQDAVDRREALALARMRPGQDPAHVTAARRARWSALPWSEDDEARAFVAEHPDGAGLDEIGAWLGLSRERVRQMEAAALERLGLALRRAGVHEATSSDVVAWCDGISWHT